MSPTYLGRYQKQHLHQFPTDAIYPMAWLHHQGLGNTGCSMETLSKRNTVQQHQHNNSLIS